MNWLQCQRCQRVFVTFFNKIALDEILRKPKCDYCEKNFSKEISIDSGAYLASVIIMPTFLKDLNNFQLKLSWQIAGIELQEATKIVFMGYSFPMADYELRQLLARSVRPEVSIDVVLSPSDEPIGLNPYNPNIFNSTEPINKFLPEYRYRSFFGNRDIHFFYSGVEQYINDNY